MTKLMKLLVAFASLLPSNRATSNQFSIRVNGDPNFYVQSSLYSLHLTPESGKTLDKDCRALKIRISINGEGALRKNTDDVGKKELIFDSKCDNADSRKFYFAAPGTTDAGCVAFEAFVTTLANNETFRASREFCPLKMKSKMMESEAEMKSCCPCEEAVYQLAVEGLWSEKSHPKDFPIRWLAHFSDMAAASHSESFTLFEEGRIASEAFRQLAEFGSTALLQEDMRSRKKHLRTLVKLTGLWYPKINGGRVAATFRVDKNNHLLSLASMIGPSPDWVVGVSKFDLCSSHCQWIRNSTIDLSVYDGGSNSAYSYQSKREPTVPRQTIRRITEHYPEDSRSPFYGQGPMKPFARLRLTRTNLIARACSSDSTLQKQLPLTYAPARDERPQCSAVVESKSNCSAVCGIGIQTVNYRFNNVRKALASKCAPPRRAVVLCQSATCPGDVPEDLSLFTEGSDDECATSDWSSWSECSVECGIGWMSRSRRFLRRASAKKCGLKTEISQKKKCMLPSCKKRPESNAERAECATTEWTEWSPCSSAYHVNDVNPNCGPGLKVRIRHLMDPDLCNASNVTVPVMREQSVCFYPCPDPDA